MNSHSHSHSHSNSHVSCLFDCTRYEYDTATGYSSTSYAMIPGMIPGTVWQDLARAST